MKEVELKELEMKCIGKRMEYLMYQGELRVANVEEIEFHQGIGKWTYIGVSPFGHLVRLSKDEVIRFV